MDGSLFLHERCSCVLYDWQIYIQEYIGLRSEWYMFFIFASKEAQIRMVYLGGKPSF